MEFLYDSANLGFDAAGPADLEPFRDQLTASLSAAATPSKGHIGAALQRLMRRLGLSVSPAAAECPSLPSIFAPACHLHETIDSPGFASLRIGLTAMYPRLVAWFQHGTRVFHVDPFPNVRPDADCLTVASGKPPNARAMYII